MPEADSGARIRQLLFFDQRSAKRLLEVYVKRSLSLNDAGGSEKWRLRSQKWVTLPDGSNQARRAFSDISTHCRSVERILRTTEPDKPCDSMPSSSKLCCEGMENKTQETTERKPFVRVIFQWLSRKWSERTGSGSPTHDGCSSDGSRAPVPRPSPQGATESSSHPSKAVKKKHSLKRISFSSRDVDKSESSKKPLRLSPEDMVKLPDAVSVEPTSTYFENVSKELERIVKEGKNNPAGGGAGCRLAGGGIGSHPAAVTDATVEAWSPQADDVTVERIITLMKQHGDAINEKIQNSSSIKSFFQRLSYSSFQQLADQYVSEISRPQEQASQTAPELVQLAFTLDFTAKVAGLSNQAVSRIMGFGNQYLQDRFTQICSVHSQASGDVEHQCNSDPE